MTPLDAVKVYGASQEDQKDVEKEAETTGQMTLCFSVMERPTRTQAHVLSLPRPRVLVWQPFELPLPDRQSQTTDGRATMHQLCSQFSADTYLPL